MSELYRSASSRLMRKAGITLLRICTAGPALGRLELRSPQPRLPTTVLRRLPPLQPFMLMRFHPFLNHFRRAAYPPQT